MSILFTKRKINTDDKKVMIITCPRTDEEVLINATYNDDCKVMAQFSCVPKEIIGKSRNILPTEKDIEICEDLRRDATGCFMTIGQKEDPESDSYASFVFMDNLRLEFFSVSPLEHDTIETQPIDVDFTIYPAVWIGFFDMFALGEMVTQYRGQYRIIMNEDKTMVRICFQEEDAENIETFAVADKMLVILTKRAHYLVEIIIGGITEYIDED